jgi:hypothetical protein
MISVSVVEERLLPCACATLRTRQRHGLLAARLKLELPVRELLVTDAATKVKT